jgi:hypothetical protein
MVMRSRSLVVVVLGLVALGCAARSRPSAPPSPATAAPLSAAMLGAEGVLTRGDVLDRLFEAPEVTAAGHRLLDRLAREPALVPRYDDFLARLFAHPAVLASFGRVAAPEGSVDALAETVLARVSAGIDGPAFDTALDGALDRLFDRPHVDAAFGRMADAMVERARFTERLAALMLEGQPELEAAVGVPLADARFAERLEQHLAVPARASALRQLLAERVVDGPGVRTGFAALLDDEAFAGACTLAVGKLLDSPAFHDHAAGVLVGMIDEVDADELGRRVDRVLVTPAMEAAVIAWVDEVTASAAFGVLSEELGLVLEDPSVRAELLSIVAGVPARQTA